MHKSLYGPSILGNRNLRIVITMRKCPFPRIHGPYDDLCIRSFYSVSEEKSRYAFLLAAFIHHRSLKIIRFNQVNFT